MQGQVQRPPRPGGRARQARVADARHNGNDNDNDNDNNDTNNDVQ